MPWRKSFQRNPDDHEAAAFLCAFPLLASSDEKDPNFTADKKAAAVLEKLLPSSQTIPEWALPDPCLRQAATGAIGTSGGAALRTNRTHGSACAAHAVAHFCPGGIVAGRYQFEPRFDCGHAQDCG